MNQTLISGGDCQISSHRSRTKRRNRATHFSRFAFPPDQDRHASFPRALALCIGSFVFGKDFLFLYPIKEIRGEKLSVFSRSSDKFLVRWEDSPRTIENFIRIVSMLVNWTAEETKEKQFDREKEKFLWTVFGLMKKAMESPPFSLAKCDFSSSSKWEKNQLNDEEKQMKTNIETLDILQSDSVYFRFCRNGMSIIKPKGFRRLKNVLLSICY